MPLSENTLTLFSILIDKTTCTKTWRYSFP